MGISNLMLLLCFIAIGIGIPSFHADAAAEGGRWQSNYRKVIDVEGGPESVVWIVQLSDLHFSVHHPDRALDFKRIVGPTLSFINPSLVLITGDLTGSSSPCLFDILSWCYLGQMTYGFHVLSLFCLCWNATMNGLLCLKNSQFLAFLNGYY